MAGLPRFLGRTHVAGLAFVVAGLMRVVGAPFAGEFQFRQPDGTLIRLLGEGDEFYAHFETPDGYTVVFDPRLRAYCYARLSPQGTLDSTGAPVHLVPPESLGLVPGLRPAMESVRAQIRERRRLWEEGMEIQTRWEQLRSLHRARETAQGEYAPPTSPTVGTFVGLCLLVDFPDEPGTIPPSEIEAFLNADQYTRYGNNGSVKQYFRDVSNGRLTYSNVVTVYVRVPRPKSYYDDPTKDDGEQANELIRDAIAALKALPNYYTQILPRFQGLTVDSQNRVVACNVFYAGGNSGVWSQGLWPHAWALYRVGAQELSPGGKKIYRYQITDMGWELELGTFVHETGHLLCGFPDLYDYDQDSRGGAGMFCLMGYGSHAQGEKNPVQVSAYLKVAAGWATVTDLTQSSAMLGTLTAVPGSGFNHFYRYRKPGVSTEYFLMECRYQTNRDAGLPGSGIAIWHIDELGDRDNQSRVPNTRHENFEVTLVQADNRWDLHYDVNSGDRYDLWYLGNSSWGYANVFSDTSAPAARWWDGTASGLYLHQFSAPGPRMEFVVGNVDLAPRILSAPSDMVLYEGTNVTLKVTATGLAPLYYQWHRNGAALAGATTSEYRLQPASFSHSGRYSVMVSNRFGVAWSREAVVTVVAATTLENALDTTGLTWQTDGNAAWYGQLWVTKDGVDAAVSGVIGPNQFSRVFTTVAGPGTVSFWWKVSSEPGFDLLRFLVNGQEWAVISGEIDWTARSFELGPGHQTLQWEYRKDGSVNGGQDRGWLDRVVFVARPMAPVILAGPRSQGVMRGGSVTMEVLAEGTPPLWYQWLRNGSPIAGATAARHVVTSVSDADVGVYEALVLNPYGVARSAPAHLWLILVGAVGDGSLGQTNLPAEAVEVRSIAAGLWHSLALRADGRVVAWGYNQQGQCDVPAGLSNVVAIAAGGYHSLALRRDGTVVGWGANDVGQSRPPGGLSNVVAVAAGLWHSLALTEDGRVVAWGDNGVGQCAVPPGLSSVVSIAAGGTHSVALMRNGRVVAWGNNRNARAEWVGQAIVPIHVTNAVSIAAGHYHSVAVLANGRVVAWGDNSRGQLGLPAGLTNAVAVSAGAEHSVALLADGKVLAWGDNRWSQCDLPAGQRMAWVAAGGYHTVYVLESVQVPRLVRYGRGDTGFRLWVQGSPRWRYGLEYAERLNAPSWTALPAVRGQPGLVGLEDPGPLPSQRFYRVRQE